MKLPFLDGCFPQDMAVNTVRRAEDVFSVAEHSTAHSGIIKAAL